METNKIEPWITMADFCSIHKIKTADFKEIMIKAKLAEMAQISVNLINGKLKERFVPTYDASHRNIARKSVTRGKSKKSHNLSTWWWRNAYISKVFKVELKSLYPQPA